MMERLFYARSATGVEVQGVCGERLMFGAKADDRKHCIIADREGPLFKTTNGAFVLSPDVLRTPISFTGMRGDKQRLPAFHHFPAIIDTRLDC